MADSQFNIGALARAAGLPVTTVRFYERKKLFMPAGRTMSNYRWYDQRSLETLRFIKLAHASGFSLKDIAGLLTPLDGSARQCTQVSRLIEHRLEKVRLQLKELGRLERILEKDLAACRSGAPRCAVLMQLRDEARQAGTPTFIPSKTASKKPR
jgi:DNA-binding transcriptional MerR regulator